VTPQRAEAAPAPAYQAIFAAVRQVPRGRVCTYGEIARMAGASGARQVGYALHSLGGASAVPWHRVVNARGAISLAGAAAERQRAQLLLEGVQFSARGLIDLKKHGWVGRP
jgi:methylated-DNA-protein-cysteine methyltransferase related protein